MKSFRKYMKEDIPSQENYNEANVEYRAFIDSISKAIKRRMIDDRFAKIDDGFITYATGVGISKEHKDLIIYLAPKKDQISDFVKIKGNPSNDSGFGFFKNKPLIMFRVIDSEDDLLKLDKIVDKDDFIDEFANYLEWLDSGPEMRIRPKV